MLVFASVSFAAVSSSARADEAGWTQVEDRHGVRVERRPVAGSDFPAVRVTTHSPLPPLRVAAALWVDRYDGDSARHYRKKRVVIRDGVDDRVIYEQIKTPVVSDRDYTLHTHRFRDLSGGVQRVTIETQNSLGPPENPEHVRIPEVHAEWIISPAGDGGSQVVYVCHSEPGGSVPEWIVRSAQVQSARGLVVEVVDWAANHPANP